MSLTNTYLDICNAKQEESSKTVIAASYNI